ncbi:palmitoyltransferase [Coelomomyces lativittatus]|nr:palmitoyltransferase [Coelomomyces lativittatus]KAJ1508670.1 palmitoyltransferase [Coelomomyces lativittatus]
MKIYCVILLTSDTPAEIRAAEYSLEQFGFFQRGSVQEFMNFTAKTLVERTQPGQRQSLEQDDYLLHCHVSPDHLGGVVVTDKEYPMRVAFSFIKKAMDDFSAKYPSPSSWKQITVVKASQDLPSLKLQLNKYQDPHEADNLLKVQKELDETKVILHKTIDSVLQRGEKLDDLVNRSNALSMQSKAFYSAAKKTNKCCSMM